MSRDAESFLAAVRDREDPTREDQARVLAAVRAAVAGGAIVGLAASGGKLTKLASGFGTTALKGTAVVLCLAGAAKLALPENVEPPSSTNAVASATAPVRKAREHEPIPASEPEVASEPSRAAVPSAKRRANAEGARPVPVVSSEAAESARGELAILAGAQAALRAGDAASALSLLGTKGPADARFSAERRALRVRALCAAGREAEARREASLLLQSEPSSLQRAAVARSCAGSESDPAR